jgi:hypothetical protein
MRLVVFFISLLCGCSAPMVRCDAHLKPINLPAAGGGISETSGTPDSAGGTPPSRRAP